MIYAFGEFELDDAVLELRLRGRVQALPRRVLAVLLHLLRNRTRAISRNELAEAVWEGQVVSDAALSQAIMVARKVTLDDGDQQRVIRTVRGHGFRFVAEVAERQQGAASPLARLPATLRADTCRAEPGALLGRDRELAELRALLVHAEQGYGSLVLLEGEPGIGKTTLVERFCAEAGARGASVLWGRCWEEGGAPAFWPFVQVLRALVELCGADTVRSWLEADGVELLSLVPELFEKPRLRAPANPFDIASTQMRFRVFDAMAGLLVRVAHAFQRHGANGHGVVASALVIALEDLHAADEASLQLLRFLTPDLRKAPLLVVGTFRDLEVMPQSALAALLGGPLENTRRLALRRLERHDVALLAERLTGKAVDAATLDLLHELSGGNPFLLGELARCSPQELERSALSLLRIPERMARAVHRRLSGQPGAARTLLEAAAALGREFSLAWLGVVLGCTVEALLSDLDPALRAGIVEAVPGSAGAHARFAHALVRDTIYGELSLARRVALHRRIAEALEVSCRDQPPVYELAHHFYLAAPSGCAPKALDYMLRAASQAEQVLAFDGAASLRDRATELCAGAGEQSRLYELLLGAGLGWYRAGELEKACDRLLRAAEHARAQEDGPRMAIAVAWYMPVRRAAAIYDARVLPLIRSALAGLGSGDSVPKALLLGYRTLSLNSFGPRAERDAATQEAVAMARRLSSDFALTVALSVRRWMMAGALHPSETLTICDELVELARRSKSPEFLLEGLYWRLQDLLELGELELAERDLAEYSALAASERHMSHQFCALIIQAAQRTWSGSFAEGSELAERARSLGRRTREPTADLLHALQLSNVYTLRGASGDNPNVAELFPAVSALPAARAFSMHVLLKEERYDEARRLYEELSCRDFTDLPDDPFRRIILSLLGGGCSLLDDVARAPRLYELLSPDAELYVLALSWVFVGPVSWVLARLALCMRDHERAVRHFERALVQCAQIGARPLLARVQYEYAHALRQVADTERAEELLEESRQTAQQLGIARDWPLPPALRARLTAQFMKTIAGR